MPSDLDLPKVELGRYFGTSDLARADRFERFLRINFVLSSIALLAALWLFAKKGERFIRDSAAGRVGTGMLLGMLAFGVVWLSQLPFDVAGLWWQRRYGITKVDYWELIFGGFVGLAGEFAFICLAIVIVMGLAGPLGRRWWVAGAPAFAGLALLFAFVFPWLQAPSTHKLRDTTLAAEARAIARQEGVGEIKVRVEDVHEQTSAANAFAAGLGPSRIVVLWDTLLDGRFSREEVRFVLAHEFGHHAREHIWKSLAWYALFAVPGAFLITLATRRRGGLRQPASIPLALFVLTALQLVALPVDNVITRRMEAEADWSALQTTRDPACGINLFRHFTTTSLSDPHPPTWAYLVLETHPTVEQRIAMMEAWKKRFSPSRDRCPAAVPLEDS